MGSSEHELEILLITGDHLLGNGELTAPLLSRWRFARERAGRLCCLHDVWPAAAHTLHPSAPVLLASGDLGDMAKLSSMVNRRYKAAYWLRGGVTANGRRPAKVLERRMAAVLEEGEQVPDVVHFIDVLSRMLVHEAEKLETTDDERWHGTAAAQIVRRSYRDPAVDELRQMIVDLRKCLIGMYGTKEASDLLSIRGRTPRGTEDVLSLGRYLVLSLPTIELPASSVDIGVSPRTWARKMQPLVERLETHVAAARSRTWTQDMAIDARNHQLGDFDGTYGPVTRLIESVFLLGGEARKARKLRLRFRRRLVNRRAAMAEDSVAGAAMPWAAAVKATGYRLGLRLRRTGLLSWWR